MRVENTTANSTLPLSTKETTLFLNINDRLTELTQLSDEKLLAGFSQPNLWGFYRLASILTTAAVREDLKKCTLIVSLFERLIKKDAHHVLTELQSILYVGGIYGFTGLSCLTAAIKGAASGYSKSSHELCESICGLLMSLIENHTANILLVTQALSQFLSAGLDENSTGFYELAAAVYCAARRGKVQLYQKICSILIFLIHSNPLAALQGLSRFVRLSSGNVALQSTGLCLLLDSFLWIIENCPNYINTYVEGILTPLIKINASVSIQGLLPRISSPRIVPTEFLCHGGNGFFLLTFAIKEMATKELQSEIDRLISAFSDVVQADAALVIEGLLKEAVQGTFLQTNGFAWLSVALYSTVNKHLNNACFTLCDILEKLIETDVHHVVAGLLRESKRIEFTGMNGFF